MSSNILNQIVLEKRPEFFLEENCSRSSLYKVSKGHTFCLFNINQTLDSKNQVSTRENVVSYHVQQAIELLLSTPHYHDYSGPKHSIKKGQGQKSTQWIMGSRLSYNAYQGHKFLNQRMSLRNLLVLTCLNGRSDSFI